MTDRLYDTTSISRRKVLAGLGTIGLASAGAGLGTSAFFNDRESVRAALEAGRLDLLVDYRATYSPWTNLYAGVYPTSPDVDVVTDEEGNVVEEGPIYVVGQAPDLRYADDNSPLSGEDWAAATRQIDACEPLGDSATVTRSDGSRFDVVFVSGPDALPAPGSAAAETFSSSYVDGPEGFMFTLDDVKPKDTGEATISLHLCDNPGYLWAQPFLTASEENGLFEPEATAGDTSESAGELADYLHVSLWYDENCNNLKDGGDEQETDVMLVFDRSGSMDDLPNKFQSAKDGAILALDVLGPSANVGLVSYASSATLDHPLGDSRSAIESTINGLSASGTTAIGDAIQVAEDELLTGSAARSGARKVMIVLTNGSSNTGSDPATQASQAQGAGIDIYGIAYGDDANEATVEDISSPPKDDDGVIEPSDEFAFLAEPISTIEDVFSEIAQEIAGEICIWEGSLAGLIADLDNFGLNAFPFDGAPERNCALNDPADVSCFEAGVSCIGFEWYLPCDLDELRELGSCYSLSDGSGVAGSMFAELVDRGVISSDGSDFDINVVQTDTLEFGARFAAVQCRHNMENPSPFATEMDETATASTDTSNPA